MPAMQEKVEPPWVARGREQKAVELEDLARKLGIRSADIEVEGEARERLLVALAEARGKRRSQVHASLKTWRVLWKFLRDAETRPGAERTAQMDSLTGEQLMDRL